MASRIVAGETRVGDDTPADTGDSMAAPSPRERPGALAVAAVASIGAGVVHAAAAGSHSEHRPALMTFVLLSALQVAWGALALVRSRRWVGLLGAGGNAVAVAGWVVATTSGIGAIDGLDTATSVGFADGAAAALAAVAVGGGLLAAVASVGSRRDRRPFLGAAALASVALTVPAMVSAADHGGSGGQDGHGHGAGGHDDAASAVPPRPYDATRPVDLGGVPGVSAEQQAEAEDLVTITLERLPQFADPATAEARGYRSIGDAPSGFEHYINWALIRDDRVFDPDHPESLVYLVEGDTKTLAAAMFMLPPGETLDTAPDIGGSLIQWHFHEDLCFSGPPDAMRLADWAPPDEDCPPGTRRMDPVPMVHVWVVPHECGPFAALEGVGGGTVPEGETPACDSAHGSHAPGAVDAGAGGLPGP
jgi:hypothetical protein